MFRIGDESLSVEEGCQNFLVTGGIGSGKTNALNYLACELTRNQPQWGGLWLDNKGNSEAELRSILTAYGRKEDAIVLRAATDGSQGKTYNVFSDPAFTPSILANAIMEVTSSNNGNHAEFFKVQSAMHIAKAIETMRVLGENPSFTGIFPYLTDQAETLDMVVKLKEIDEDPASRTGTLASHFENKFLSMPPDQFGGVVGTILNALSPFQTPEVAAVFSATNPDSFQFADLEKGRVLCISLPQRFPQERYALNALFKQLFYQYAMTRYDLPRDRLKEANVLALWLDEAQHSLRKGDWGDYRWLDRLRAAKCAAILAMQDHTSTYPILGKDVAIVTLAQLRNRLIFSAPTFESAEITANFIGKREVQRVTRGYSGGRSNISRTPHEEHILKPKDINGLKNHFCHVYLATKTLRRNLKLPRCEPSEGMIPGR